MATISIWSARLLIPISAIDRHLVPASPNRFRLQRRNVEVWRNSSPFASSAITRVPWQMDACRQRVTQAGMAWKRTGIMAGDVVRSGAGDAPTRPLLENSDG
jgi:hypothetical protein